MIPPLWNFSENSSGSVAAPSLTEKDVQSRGIWSRWGCSSCSSSHSSSTFSHHSEKKLFSRQNVELWWTQSFAATLVLRPKSSLPGFDQDRKDNNEWYLNPKIERICFFVEKIPNANNKDGGTKKHQPHMWPKKPTMWHLAVTRREQELLGGANIASLCTKCTAQVDGWKWDQKVTFCNFVIDFQVRGAVFHDLCMGRSNQVEAIDLIVLQDLNARWRHWYHQNNHFLKPSYSRAKRLRDRRFQKGVLIFTMLTSAFLCE